MSNTALHWQPARTWVVVVGLLAWKHPDVFDPFPQANRRDAQLARCLEQRGVPASQIIYLKDRQATLKRIEQTLAEHLRASTSGDLLLLYYCGHGYRDDSGTPYFACYDAGDDDVPGWRMDTLPDTIERVFQGSHALLAADCCYSGCMADAIAERRSPLAYACLTSSSVSELSTGNWTFTEGLIAGLEGRAFSDTDANAAITLGELAAEIQGDMAFAEEQLASFTTSGGFTAHLKLGPALQRATPNVGRRVEVLSEGDWYKARIIDADAERLRVHYYGYESSDDEWVTADCIRDVAPVQYPVGSSVEVHWKRKWYDATIREQRGGVHYVRYNGYNVTWDEWVPSARIRPAG